MKTRSVMKTATFVLVMVLTFAICAAQAGEVKLQGKINNDGKGVITTDGKQYTIIPTEAIDGMFRDLVGKSVELSGVVYQSHGHDMITVFSFEKLP